MMDNELYCPMKMTSNPLGRCVCEKEKCAWWNELGSCCSVWWIATELDKIETKIKSESMNEWISVNDSQPKKDGIYFAVYKFLDLNDCVSTREFRDGKWIEEVGREEVRFWMPIPKLPKEA